MMVLLLRCPAQVAPLVPAPAALPPCLILYSANQLGHIFSRLMWYGSNQQYVDINNTYSGIVGPGTEAPLGPGTFTYSVDPQNPAHATITYEGGASTDQLYFYTATSGNQTGTLISDGSMENFTLYPQQASNGAGNMSQRCELAAGGTCISGFVIQSGGPRWVLLRAVGDSLSNFGVSGAVANPSFTLYDSTGAVVGTSSVWSADPNLVGGYETVFSMVGAFALESGSDESVLLVSLNPGAYTAMYQASTAGTILCETYILPF